MMARVAGCAISLASLFTIIFIQRRTGLNSTTIALGFLLVVLGAATIWGLTVAIITSVAAVLAFNFFFIPPLHTFTVDDSQNWIALAAFLITAATASQLSARAQRRTAEAQARRLETERLYDLGRAILMNQQFDRTLEQTASDVARIFEFDEVAFYDAEKRTVYRAGQTISVSEVQLAEALTIGNAHQTDHLAVAPVRLGGKPIGSLALRSRGTMSDTVIDAIANLAAISVERSRAIERATMAEASRRNEQLRAAMLDALAHDLKTPLTAIKAAITSLISAPPRSAQGVQELLSIINEENERLNQTVSEAVQMARIDAGKVTLDRRLHDIRQVIENSLATLRPADLASRVDVHLAPSLPQVDIDADLIRQALNQLLDNAGKYSIANGRIEIAAVEEGDAVVISVSDRGPGIDMEERQRIFEKFYRGAHGSSAVEGTGMGLSIAKGIVEAHGGKIWAMSNRWGGATFLFRLRKAGSDMAK
jgi:two-component system sensor histidine kinase KdpD